jgi:hypothetical protein
MWKCTYPIEMSCSLTVLRLDGPLFRSTRMSFCFSISRKRMVLVSSSQKGPSPREQRVSSHGCKMISDWMLRESSREGSREDNVASVCLKSGRATIEREAWIENGASAAFKEMCIDREHLVLCREAQHDLSGAEVAPRSSRNHQLTYLCDFVLLDSRHC